MPRTTPGIIERFLILVETRPNILFKYLKPVNIAKKVRSRVTEMFRRLYV